MDTVTVVDHSRIGRKGYPMHSGAFPDAALPTKEVPVEDGEPVDSHSGLNPFDVFRTEIQSLIDTKARQKQYDSGATIASYVNSTVPGWAAEAQAFVAWRDQIWAYALGELVKIQNAEREQPSVFEFLAELPTLEWPGKVDHNYF